MVDSKDHSRILKEYKQLREEAKIAKGDHLTVEMVKQNPRHWKGKIFGPKDTCYEGGIFMVDIQFPQQYPFKPPLMKFDTQIWHPNISSQTGAICLDILKSEWTPALTIRTALLSLQALLCTPQPGEITILLLSKTDNLDDPQDAQVAEQYKKDREGFHKYAKFIYKYRAWTQNYAKPDVSKQQKVKNLMQMGFERALCEEALARYDYNQQLALNYLLQ